MRIPIQYALTYPERLTSTTKRIDFFALKRLNFQKPDFKKFPCLSLAYRAARQSGTAPCVLNAANEVAVEAFLKGALSFMAIPSVIEKVLGAHRRIAAPSLKDIREADCWAKAAARKAIYYG
jgi:1-deoxy-D-xylulose-5-phosphate reductoisomerase